jgi:hypothetical protein
MSAVQVLKIRKKLFESNHQQRQQLRLNDILPRSTKGEPEHKYRFWQGILR